MRSLIDAHTEARQRQQLCVRCNTGRANRTSQHPDQCRPQSGAVGGRNSVWVCSAIASGMPMVLVTGTHEVGIYLPSRADAILLLMQYIDARCVHELGKADFVSETLRAGRRPSSIPQDREHGRLSAPSRFSGYRARRSSGVTAESLPGGVGARRSIAPRRAACYALSFGRATRTGRSKRTNSRARAARDRAASRRFTRTRRGQAAAISRGGGHRAGRQHSMGQGNGVPEPGGARRHSARQGRQPCRWHLPLRNRQGRRAWPYASSLSLWRLRGGFVLA
jgi:hypothetical protein